MGAGHWLNPTTGQCEQVTTHNDWIRDETNADSIGLAEDLYRQIMLLPDTAIDRSASWHYAEDSSASASKSTTRRCSSGQLPIRLIQFFKPFYGLWRR